jgi:hypothetical protein
MKGRQMPKPKPNLVSPNDLQQHAIQWIGHEPEDETDWLLCVNYWAANIAKGLEESACLLLAKLFDCPLSDEQIKEVAAFQKRNKS